MYDVNIYICPGFKSFYSKFSPVRALSRPAQSAGFLRHLYHICICTSLLVCPCVVTSCSLVLTLATVCCLTKLCVCVSHEFWKGKQIISRSGAVDCYLKAVLVHFVSPFVVAFFYNFF